MDVDRVERAEHAGGIERVGQGRAAPWALAALSGGAAVIHLAMVPPHAQESLGMGLAFAVAGWAQLALGVALVVRPDRRWLLATAVANLLFVGVWGLSRTVGLPTWTGDGGAQDAAAVDLAAVAFEAVIVIGALVLLAAPSWGTRAFRSGPVLAGLASVGILVATTAVLAAPSTADHGHGGDAADGHAHDGDGDGSGSGEAGEEMAADGHHHDAEEIAYDDLPGDTKAQVDDLIDRWAERYPTAGDAMAAGWFRGTRNLYGIGAHYIQGNVFAGANEFELMEPNILLYDGDGPDAPFAGVSYTMAVEPEGFAGPYDSWHAHGSICIREGDGVISLTEEDSDVWLGEDECLERGGDIMPLSSAEMIHVWIGPGYMGDAPIFAHDHPALYDGFHPQSET